MATLTINKRKGEYSHREKIALNTERITLTAQNKQKSSKCIACTDSTKNKYTRQHVQTLSYSTTIYCF